MPHVTLLAVTSADGFIAREADQHSFSWNSPEDKTHFLRHLKKMDINLIGRTSYEIHAREMAVYPCICLTRSVTEPQVITPNLTHLNPDNTDLMRYLHGLNVENVGILGGSEVYRTCLNAGLVDEIYQTVEPVYFGQGVAFLGGLTQPLALQLRTVTQLNKRGTLLLHYQRNNR